MQTNQPPAAQFTDVVKSFGAINALNGVSFRLETGQVTALLGPNGAGKTTAIRHILGLSPVTRGSVQLFGGDPRQMNNRRRTGVMMQISGVPPTLRVKEHLELFSSYYPDPMPINELVEIASLQGLEERPFGKLSGGQKQRVLFALSLCGNPDLLLLDEPTAGLDLASRRCLWDQIRTLTEEQRTVLLTTHYLEEADALADRIIVLHQGQIVADGPPAEIKAKVATRTVRFVSSLDADELRKLAGAHQVRQDGPFTEIQTEAAEPLVASLLARDPGLSQLEIQSCGLEEAFLKLTHDSSLTSNQSPVERKAS